MNLREQIEKILETKPTAHLGTDAGPGHVYRDTPLVSFQRGARGELRVTRKCHGLEWHDENREALPQDFVPPCYGEAWTR